MLTDRSTLLLTSNGLPVSLDGEPLGELRPGNDLLGDPDALRRRMAEDGYLFLRGILDRDEVLEVRRGYLDDHGAWDRRPDAAGIHGRPGHPAHALVRSAEFQAFVGQPRLVGLARVLLGGAVSVLPRTILRHYRPATRRASRAHRDWSYVDGGTERVLTAWLPLGDCPIDSGGLVYLEDSDDVAPEALREVVKVTDRPGDERPLSHDLAWVASTLGRRWMGADYAAGDVVFHSAQIIHASLDVLGDEPRVSADVRFIPAGDAADPRWLRPWSGDDGY